MAKPAPSRVAAALNYLERLKNQAAEFGGGVVENLADRARSAGELAYEALTSDPAIGRMTTAEFSEAANRPTPRLDQAARDIGTIGRAIVTQPIQTGKAIVQGEVERAREAMSSPRAAGEYAGSFIDPMRLAAALRHRIPIREIDAYHGTAGDFEAFDPKMGGRATGAGSAREATWFVDKPKVAEGYAVHAAEVGPYDRKIDEAKTFMARYEQTNDPADLNQYYKLVREAGDLEKTAFDRKVANARLMQVDIPDETKFLEVDAGGKTPLQLSEESNIDSWLQEQLRQARKQNKEGVKIVNLDDTAGGVNMPATHYAVFDPSGVKIKSKVRILERNGQPAPERIAQALEAAPSAFEQRLREQYGDFAQAYNLGLPDTPEYRRIVQEVTAQGPLSDDALREAIGAHPAYRQAGGKAAAAELRQSKRNGAAALVDSLSEQGIKTRVETSKSPGSRSTYIYASRGDKTVKIRLSDHLPAESGRVYGTNDIMTTPQHWKAATKRALKLLEETE